MARVLSGTVKYVDESNIVFGDYAVSTNALPKAVKGDQVVVTIDSFKPEPTETPTRKIDPRGRPSIPGAK